MTLSTVQSPTENSRIQGLFKAFDDDELVFNDASTLTGH